MAARQIYKVIFMNQGQTYEIYARTINQGGLFGFIEVEEIVFGERSSPTASRNVTTATAAAIVAELGSGVRVGTTFRIILRNQAAATHAMTLVGGTGVTLDADNTNTAAAASTREFIGRVTAIASGSETVTVYSMPSGTH